MTTKKAGPRKTRKKSPQAASRYRTVRVLRKTRENLADKIEGYLKDGRKFYRRARKDPRKTFDSVVEESRGVVEDLGSEASDRVKGLVRDSRKLIGLLEKDGRMAADRLQTAGKETLEKLSGRKRAGKAEPLVIKKYVNGRFYDTVNKKYLKKDDLARLVKKQADIRIIYSKTGRNITRTVVAGLAVDAQGGKKARLSLDEVSSWLKENQTRIRETIDRQVNAVRKAIKLPA